MTSPLLSFAERFESVEDRESAVEVIERVQNESPEKLDQAVEAVAQDLDASDHAVRLRAVRTLHSVSKIAGESIQPIAFDLVTHLDDDRTRPYAGGALQNALTSSSEIAPSVETLADRASVRSTPRRTLRYLFWISKKRPEALEPATDVLVDCLEDSDETVREYAVKTLNHASHHLEPTGAIPPLSNLTDDPNPTTRANATVLLAELVFDSEDNLGHGLEETFDAIIDQLRADRTSVRLTATTALNHAIRLMYAFDLDDDRWHRVASALVTTLDSDSERLVGRGTTLIRHLGRERPTAFRPIVDELITYTQTDTGPDWRRRNVIQAVVALSEESPEAVAHELPTFVAMLEETQFVQHAGSIVETVVSTESVDPSVVTSALITGLESPDREGRKAVGRALAVVGREYPDDVPRPVQVLADVDESGQIGEPLAVLARETPEFTRERVAGLCENLRNDETRRQGFLFTSLAEEDPRVLESGVTVLVDLLDSRNPDVRERVAKTLGKLGEKHPETVASAVEQIATSLDGLDRFSKSKLLAIIQSIAKRDPTAVSSVGDEIATELGARDSTARRKAAETLQYLAEADSDAVPETAIPLAEADSDEWERPLSFLAPERPEFVRSILTDARTDLPDAGRGTSGGIGELIVEVASTDAGRELVEPTLDDVREQVSADSGRTRRNATIALNYIADWRAELITDAIEPLVGRLCDHEELLRTRTHAAEALVELASVEPDDVDDVLRETVESPDALVSSFPSRSREAVETLADRITED